MDEKKRPAVNPNFRGAGKRRQPISAKELTEGVLSGNRVMLGRAITMIESKKPEHQQIARDVIEGCLPHSGNALRIGITGTPGVGKSTFVEALGNHILDGGKKIAVLAIDPSSQKSHGSILGDKTRMAGLSAKANAFIRPSPAGDALGGVARQSRETMILCEAAGYDYILVETVGVGQSEIAVHSMTDFFLLLLLPGAGDELQGIKRGIVEMADLIAVNKADGEGVDLAKKAKREYRNALHLFPPQESGWIPAVKTCSALEGTGIPDIWDVMLQYETQTKDNGFFAEKRRKQAGYWLEETLNNSWKQAFLADPELKNAWEDIKEKVEAANLSPFRGAMELMDLFFTKNRK
ncbi:MAG: methylmalonyl Co-A mutase-associated GTPase MeaB [Bacteroidetes bacterium]|nr:methylmalonyl Co-A mutase-associated GTPase MeaB [Bacteroidota bacterium]